MRSVLARNVKFWGKNTLESLGISLAGAAAVLLFLVAAGTDYSGQEGLLSYLTQLFPYYLFVAGVFVNAILAISYFQVYFSVLLSMNVTRKEITLGILGSLTACNLGILLLVQLVWRIFSEDISADGLRVFPLLTGILFLVTALLVILGVVILRWGKIGTIIMGICFALLGGFCGFWMSAAGRNGFDAEFFSALSRGDYSLVLAAGLLVYVLAGVFAVVMTRKTAVRV